MILSKLVTSVVAFIVLFLLACILFGESLVVTLAEILKMDDCRPLLVPVFMFFMVVSVHIAVLLSLIFFK
ncbi:hypothetical protein N568_0101230 [Lactococcus garvieae TRF1]|uniref:Uncharacterized protein n=1 Tax=Lactococcus garvieae TRF1 TaxID=1380772 RepID=V8ASZ4_9LACT|nr:hypothetical protein N568_0101230 [Lactococcus garvieae TRF1]